MRQVEPQHLVDPESVTREDGSAVLERVRAIAPRFKERALDAERLRRLPDASVAELQEVGLFRALQPTRFGGLELPRSIFRSALYEIAQKCGSTAWVAGVLSASSGALAAMFPPEAQADVWADPDALLCNVLFPAGSAVPAEGGYVLSGRFPYASGCDLARWAILGARISGTDAPAGSLGFGFVVPMSEISIEDDWHVLGLAATGSKTLTANEVFVPAHRVRPIPDPGGTIAHYSFSAVAVGVAKGAVERFVEYATTRGTLMRGWSVESDAMRAKVSEAAAEVDAAWALICRDCAEGEDALWRTGNLPASVKARNRRNAAYATRLALQAVDRLYVTSGGSAAYSASLVQQSFRDAHTAGLHYSMNWDAAAIEAGRVLLQGRGEFVF
jgi:alkylation response protein AidB-like acyl-CoA dehydrogenase